jgi:HD superfamily phosphodiesterase
VNAAYLKRTLSNLPPAYIFTADSIVNPWINVIAGISAEEYCYLKDIEREAYMINEIITRFEARIESMDGNAAHGRRVLYLCKLIAAKESIAFDDDVLTFAAYFHDIAAYPFYAKRFAGSYDHATESAKLVPGIAEEYGFDGRQLSMIVEAVEYHNKAKLGSFNETRLLRNADGVDYLGYVAAARDIVKSPNDFAKALELLKSRKEQFYPMIDLPFALELAAPRIEEREHFIARFEEEIMV